MPDHTFFPGAAFLEKRLGRELFDTFPNLPGIYRFYNEQGKLLYVGKAKNLRRRLFSYKRAGVSQVSEKVSRLVSQVSHIDFETTCSEEEALLLENRWIRRERPPFNHANKKIETYYFIYIKPERNHLDVRLSMSLDPKLSESCYYGVFKGHGKVRRPLGCLLRFLWMAEHRNVSPHHLPVQLTRRLTPMYFTIAWQPASPMLSSNIPDMIRLWMLGESCELLDWFVVHIDDAGLRTRFQNHFFEHHLDQLKTFYDRTLIRHARFRELRNNAASRLIARDELDDLIVIWKRKVR